MSQSEKQAQFIGTAPYLVVSDLLASVRYYHEVLGFDLPKLWGDPPDFAMPSRDGFVFMLKQADPWAIVRRDYDSGDHWDVYVWIRDANALYAELTQRGARFAYEPHVREGYSMLEFGVLDLDDHVIGFGQHYEA